MKPRGRGAHTYPLEELTDGEFEALTFLLARTVDQAVLPVRNKDRGLDVRLPDERQLTRRGWQAKPLAKGAIHWGQCRGSVEAAVAFWRPPHITFLFAHELSAKEQDQFRTELVEQVHHPITIDYTPEAEIQRWLRDTEGGRQAAAWLWADSEPAQEQMQRALAMSGPLRDAAHAAERLAEIQDHLDRDPHFDYTTVTDKVGAPETPSAEGTFLSVSTRHADKEVRFDAREKYPGALNQFGLKGDLVFNDEEAAQAARRTIENVERTGESASISGVGMKFTTVPVGMRGVMTDELVYGELTLMPVASDRAAPPPPELVGIVCAGEHELGMAFALAETPVQGWEGTLAGAAGGLEIFHSMRQGTEGLEHKLDWRHRFGEGSALEQLLACRVLRAVLAGDQVRLLTPGTREQIWLLAPVEGEYSEDIRDLEHRERVLELVAEFEAWTGEPVVVPAQPTEDDGKALGRALVQIRTPEGTATWERFEVVLEEQIPDHPIEVRAFEPRYVTLFGQEIFLGVEVLSMPLAVAAPAEGGAQLTPVRGHEELTTHLHRPAAFPVEAARPPGRDHGGWVQYRDPPGGADSAPAA